MARWLPRSWWASARKRGKHGEQNTERTDMDDSLQTTEALRHKLIADLLNLPVWERGRDRVVTPPWHALTIAERDLIADALKQWKKS